MYAQADLRLRWAHIQSCRKCCASAEFSEILSAGFIFVQFLASPLLFVRLLLSLVGPVWYCDHLDGEEKASCFAFLGPVVQSVVSLTSLLRIISLTVLADSIYNILIFFAEKM